MFHQASIEQFTAQTSLPRSTQAGPGDLIEQRSVVEIVRGRQDTKGTNDVRRDGRRRYQRRGSESS
jgi:hypothetical protein